MPEDMDRDTFNALTSDVDLDEVSAQVSEQVVEQVAKILIDSLIGVAQEMVRMAMHAEDERIRYNAGKYLIDAYILNKKGDPEDKWTEVLNKVHGNKG